MKRFKWELKYLYWGVTALCVLCLAIAFYKGLDSLVTIGQSLSNFLSILSPFVWGLAITYLLNPLMKLYQQKLLAPLFSRMFKSGEKAEKNINRLGRGSAILLSLVSMIIILTAIIWLVVPQLYVSIESIVKNSPEYAASVYGFIERFLSGYPEVEELMTNTFGNLSQTLLDWVKNSLLPQFGNIITNISSGVYYVFKGLYNFLIGIIVSIYVLYNKERFAAYAKKIIYCIFSLEVTKKILEAVRFTDSVFMGFINGKIVDSAIIAVICYVGCMIMGMPYPVLISVIIGFTNIIPFFGPFIGAVPAAFIILLISPVKCLIFIIFIILLQQFDGNFLGPKILGSTVGINGFWVLFAIIVGAGLFGFMGMLLGVPVFVVIYTLIKSLVERKLERSGLPVDTAEYIDLDHVEPDTMEKMRFSPDTKKSSIRKKRKAGKAEPSTVKAGTKMGDNGAGQKKSGTGTEYSAPRREAENDEKED